MCFKFQVSGSKLKNYWKFSRRLFISRISLLESQSLDVVVVFGVTVVFGVVVVVVVFGVVVVVEGFGEVVVHVTGTSVQESTREGVSMVVSTRSTSSSNNSSSETSSRFQESSIANPVSIKISPVTTCASSINEKLVHKLELAKDLRS